ncbi:MAG: argininosuccinate lyase [Gammaproteobacteria bacterium]|nr:argininosuccinate lyase [Gammaproteobacteria bacterium]
MNYLWRSDNADTDEDIMRFLAGDDVVLDRELLPYDIAATTAHAEGLARIGIFNDAELEQVSQALQAIAEDFASGALVLDQRFEDGHSALESWLCERVGDLGARIHTGRSRNDQVLVATRLYLRDALDHLVHLCRLSAETCLQQAGQYRGVPMAGYTHLQRAVVSTVEVWFAGYAEAFIDDAMIARATREWINANPLGTAAGFGVNLDLDREYTTEALGFDRLQLNPAYTQNSRGKFEIQALTALSQALLDVRRLAWDLSLFTTAEFGSVTLPEAYTTGSSIMPNKRNPDVVELLRAACATVDGAITEINSVLSLPGGYHRDLQATKGPTLRAFHRGLAALGLLPALLSEVRFDHDKLREAIEPAMYATDRAIELAAKGVAFRDAYHEVKKSVTDGETRTPEDSIAARISAGAAGNPRLDILQQRLAALK